MGAPIKMYGPYAKDTDAVKAGFKIIKGKSDWAQFEYGFWVVRKPNAATYCFTEPETSYEHTKVTIQTPPGQKENIRAYCHSHTTYNSADGFGHPDDDNFRASQKAFGRTIGWYLLNSAGQIRYA